MGRQLEYAQGAEEAEAEIEEEVEEEVAEEAWEEEEEEEEENETKQQKTTKKNTNMKLNEGEEEDADPYGKSRSISVFGRRSSGTTSPNPSLVVGFGFCPSKDPKKAICLQFERF